MDPMQAGAPQTPPSPTGSAGPAPSAPKPPANKALIIIVALVVGLGVLGWIGSYIAGKVVQKGIEAAFEGATGVKVDQRGDTVTLKGKDGSTMVISEEGGTVTAVGADGETSEMQFSGDEGGEAKMPKDFPSDFPVVAGATLKATFSVASGNQQTFTLSWTTSQDVAAASEFYIKALPENGWRITSQAEINGSQSVVFERGPEDAEQKDSGWLAVTEEEGKTVVTLTLSLVKK